MESFTWITINYTLPMTPSGSRVYAWRKLKELGAAYLRQGVAVLPYSHDNLNKVQALAVKIRAMNGQCTLTEMRFLEEKDHLQMIETFKMQSKDEFRQLLLDSTRLYEQSGSKADERRDDKLMRKRYAKAKSRDYFNIENEIGADSLFGEIFSDLHMDGGWTELMSDLRQSYKDVGRLIAGLLPESNAHSHNSTEEDDYDNSTV